MPPVLPGSAVRNKGPLDLCLELTTSLFGSQYR